jgi:large subunit ribosomal protein L28
MAKCDICGKGPQFGNKISHSHKTTKKKWLPNIQKVKVCINNSVKKINVCTKCLKAGKVKKSI